MHSMHKYIQQCHAGSFVDVQIALATVKAHSVKKCKNCQCKMLFFHNQNTRFSVCYKFSMEEDGT